MTQEQLITLAQVYNSLMTVETKGNNTITMAKSLQTLKEIIIQLQQEKGVQIDGE